MKKEVRKQDISFLQIETYFIDGTWFHQYSRASIFMDLMKITLSRIHKFVVNEQYHFKVLSESTLQLIFFFHGSTQQNSTKSMKIIISTNIDETMQ